MNHSIALKRQSDGRWDYTTNGRPTGYCHEYVPLKEDGAILPEEMARKHNEKMQPLIGNFHADGHATSEEACECYKKYMLDTALRLTPDEPANASQQNHCQICGKFTACHAYVGAYGLFTLCPEHQTRDFVESVFSVGESLES